MVIDTSALVAILLDEAPRSGLTRAIEADPVSLVSAATVLEASTVLETRRGEAAGRELDVLLHRAQARTMDVTAATPSSRGRSGAATARAGTRRR